MEQERILATLYDMALVIGSEDRLEPLLSNTLKRLVYHTGYPVGLFLLADAKTDLPSNRYRLARAIGDHRLKSVLDQSITLPAELNPPQPTQLEIAPSKLASLPLRQDYYHCALILPVPDEGMILLLSPEASNPGVPFSTIFTPIMANLATAIQLCRANENYTQALIEDRDKALLDNERFRSALDTSDDCIFLIDPYTMRFVDFNRTAESVLGYSREELMRLGPHHIKPHASREELQKIYLSLLEDPSGSGTLTTVHQRRDGNTFPVDIRLSVLNHTQEPLVIAVVHDVTERDRAERQLFEEKERALVTLKSIGDGVITTDPEGRITFMNPVAEQLTQWRSDEVEGQELERVFRIINEVSRKPVSNPVERCLRENRIIGLANHTVLINRSGDEIAIEDSAAPIRNASGRIIGVVLVFHDVSTARELANELSWNASHDPLTELFNRREFENRLEQAFELASDGREIASLLYMDLDHFKLVNDSCGHMAGDQLLHDLATLLKRQIRESDIFARLGGDEFGLLLHHCDAAQARELAEKLQHTISQFTFTWGDRQFKVGSSIGIVEINTETESTTQLMSNADVACYTAKDHGGNRIHLYQQDDDELARRQGEMRWVARINQALEYGHFVLLAQPIVPILDTTSRPHYELLLRLKGDDGSLVSPEKFIPAAERYKLMYQIDREVVSRAAAFVAAHSRQMGDTVFAINLSGFSLTQEGLVDYIQRSFADNGVAPEQFCFEVTETAAIANLSSAISVIEAIRRLGASFALDDFGSGLSSFNYLKNLPVDYLKIDGSFIRDILDDPIDASMVDAINKVGQQMGLKTVAEYVENDAVMQKLRELGIDYAQGYGVGMPSPLENLYPVN